MKKIICLVFVAAILVLAIAVPGDARVVFRGDFVIGPGWWGPYYWPYPYYAPYYPYYAPPVVQSPPVYEVPSQPQQQPQQQENYYWYYCPDSKTYYPYTKQCPSGWLKVVPTPSASPNPSTATPDEGN